MTRPTEHGDPLSDGVEAAGGELHNPDVAHEHSDINVRAIVAFLIVLTVVGLVAAAAMWGVFVILDNQAAKADPALSPLATPAGELPPEPRLMTNEPANLEKQRERERKLLEGGEWVDRRAGVGRIPIDEAKKLLLHSGLPARAGEAVDPRLGTRAAAMSDASSGRNAVVKQTPTGVSAQPQQPGTQQGTQPAASGAARPPQKPGGRYLGVRGPRSDETPGRRATRGGKPKGRPRAKRA